MFNGGNLTNSPSLQELILDSIDERVIFHDSQMRVRWANRAASETYNLPLEKIIGRRCSDILGRSQGECANCPVKKALKTNKKEQDLLSFPDGKSFLIFAYPIFDNGKLLGVIEFSVNVTDRTRRENKLIELVDKSIAQSEAKSTFVANVSHEIRTLINVIHGMAKLVYDSSENEEEKENLSMIRDSSSFLLSLVNDLLDLSKIESGKSELKQDHFNLPQKIKQITAIFRKQAKDKGLELNYTIEKNVPHTVVSDPGKLQQVLINLIDNAIKFTEKGEINIALKLVQDGDLENELPDFNEETQTVVLFSISDTGIGIPESKLELIFEDISKYNSYHQKSCRKGTGLGLPLTKSLVELMGGAVGVRSTEGSGSTFYFTIPFTIPPNEADNPGKLAEFNSIQKLDQSALQKANGLNILLVEDRLMTQKLMTLMLEKKGHQVTVALNGNVAVKLLEEKSFDIILMDLYMPEMDGYETTAYIRNIEKGVKRTAIIAMTASATTDVRDSCLKAGMDGFISKPVTAQEIDRVIDEVMRDKSWNL